MAVRHLIAIGLLLAVASPVPAAPPAEEIEYLMTAIGTSGCAFVRNGKRHARAAESHIRMKYRRAKRHATTAERFIERLATRSSMSGRPYLMDCPDSEPVPSAAWLHDALAAYRDGQAQSAPEHDTEQ